MTDTATAPSATAAEPSTQGPSPVRRARRRNARTTAINAAYVAGSVLIAAFLIGLWQVAANNEWINGLRFGSPSGTWDALIDYFQLNNGWSQTLATGKATAIALLIGIPAGIVVGVLLAAVPALDRLLSVFLVPLNSMPRIALVPTFIIWFGLTTTTKVATAVSVVFFIALFNARAGVKSIDADLLLVSRQLGLKKVQTAWKVILPGSVPTIFAGIKISVAYAILTVVASEMIAARDGLGLDIVRYSQTLQINSVWAIILVLAVAATIINALFAWFETWLLRWQ
jgi:NitT/TauT family transport system permease protein